MKRQTPILISLGLCLMTAVAPVPAQASQPTAIRGIVLGPGGVSLVGALVTAHHLPSSYVLLKALLDGEPQPRPVAVARVDTAGRFTLSVPPAGVWQLRVEAPGFVPMRYALLPAAGEVELPVVTLRPAVKTPIEVADGAGGGLAGIAVRAASADSTLWKDPPSVGWRPAPRRGRTDGAGRLSLLRARGERLDLFVYTPRRLTATRAAQVRRARVVVGPAPSRRTLEVVEADGSPAAGVVIALAAGQWPLGLTGQSGQLSVSDSAEDVVELLLFTADGRTLKVELAPAEEGSQRARTVFRLPPSVSVGGRVVDAEGKPLSGVLVWPGHDPGRFVVTDSAGHYSLRRETSQRLRLQAHGEGRPPRLLALKVSSQPLTAPDLVLPLGVRLLGWVVDSAGGPVARARVAVLEQKGSRKTLGLDRAAGRAVTGPDGSFTLLGLPATAPLAVRVVADGSNPAMVSFDPLAEGAGREELVIVLSRGRTASGWVLDGEERPIAGAEVRLLPADEATESADSAQEGWRALTETDGHFVVMGMEEGVVDLQVSRRGYAPTRVRGLRIPRGAGIFELGTLVLERGVTLSGRVVDVVGEGVAEAAVWRSAGAVDSGSTLVMTPAGEPDVVADAAGRFALDSLAVGVSVALTVDAPGFLPLRLAPLTPPLEGPLTVTLRSALQLAGRVTDSEGVAIAGTKLDLHPLSLDADSAAGARLSFSLSRSVVSDAEGRFQFEDVEAGSYEVEAFADGYQPAVAQLVELAFESDPPALHFVLEKGAVLTGVVLDSELEPVAGARVSVGRSTGCSDAAGRYRVEGIAPGTVAVWVEHPGFDRLVRELDIELGVSEAEFVLEGGYAVSGLVVDGSDLPVGGAEVELQPLDSDAFVEYRVRADEAGAFLFERVAQGGYSVHGRLRGYAESEPRRQIRVAGAKVEEVEVRLQRGGRIEGRILGLDFDQLARVEVRATAPERHERAGEVDFEGQFTVVDLEPDDWTVRAVLAGGQRQARARVTLPPGVPSVSRDLEFGRGVTLRGLVLHGGEPVVSAQVELRRQEVPLSRSTTTDVEGRFRLEDLQPGSYQLGMAQHAQGLIHNQNLLLVDDRELLIEIETAAIAGVVVDAATGGPVDGALVNLLQQLPAGGEGSKFSFASDAQGAFHYDTLPGGRFRLSVQRNGYQPAEQTVEAAAGSTASVRVEIEPASGLEVIASLPSGKTPRYLTVWGRDGTGRLFAETRGAFPQGTPFSTLPAGEWSLLIGGTGGAVVEARVTVPSEPLQVVLPTAGRLRVRVPELVESDTSAVLTMVADGGRPFRHLAWGGRLEDSWQLVGGRALVEGVPAGLWILQVRASDGRTWSSIAASTGGPDIEVSLE